MFFLPAIIFCFVSLRGKRCTASRGEEAVHSLPWPRSVSWQPSLALLPMGFPTADPFLWGPITLGQCSFCLRMHEVCSVSAQHGRISEAVCWMTSVQWFLSFDGGAEDEFPTTEIQPLVVLPPTSSWVFGRRCSCWEPAGHTSHIVSSPGWSSTGGARQRKARAAMQKVPVQSGVPGYPSQALGCSLIESKFS